MHFDTIHDFLNCIICESIQICVIRINDSLWTCFSMC